jgi:hypothetical protein
VTQPGARCRRPGYGDNSPRAAAANLSQRR